MEQVFKRYFWAIQGVFVVVAALLLAAAVNAFAASFITGYAIALPTPDEGETLAGADSTGERLDLPPYTFGEEEEAAPEDRCADVECDEGKECNPLNGLCEAVADEEPEADGVDDGRCVESDIAINLVGTMVAEDPRWSLAVLHNPSIDRTQFASVGTTLLTEAEVLRVERNRIFIMRNGREECLRYGDQAERSQRRNEQLGTSGAPAAPTADRGTAATAPTPAARPTGGGTFEERLRDGVQRNTDGSYSIDREVIREVANNQRLLEQQAPSVQPYYENGQPRGFRLSGIRSGSMFSQIGIRNSDVIVSVDGTAIDSPQRAAELYDALIANNNVELTVLRRGREQVIRYQMQ